MNVGQLIKNTCLRCGGNKRRENEWKIKFSKSYKTITQKRVKVKLNKKFLP
jgi:hypothetical protein